MTECNHLLLCNDTLILHWSVAFISSYNKTHQKGCEALLPVAAYSFFQRMQSCRANKAALIPPLFFNFIFLLTCVLWQIFSKRLAVGAIMHLRFEALLIKNFMQG